MERPARIVIAEDHRILRDGLRALLSGGPEFEVVGEAENGRDAIRLTFELKPDLVLMDLSMPMMNGLDAIGEIKSQAPGTKVLILTVHRADEYVFEAFKAGANGYLLKDATHAELRLALEHVLAGRNYISPGISEKFVDGFMFNKQRESGGIWGQLTQRERQVLKLIAEGYKNKKIADYLCISAKTVEKHRANLMKKLDLHNASSLTAFALRQGLAEEQ